MKRQLRVGDTVKVMGIKATIASIAFQEPWEWREAWYLEFTDTNGVYRSWKQDIDGGKAYNEKGKEIGHAGFSDWLYREYGIFHDDLTDDDYNLYWAMWESEGGLEI